MAVRFNPLNNRILVRRAKAADKVSGLIVPEAAKKKMNQGEALAVGPECKGVQVGDTILFGSYSGAMVELNGEELLMLFMDEVHGTLTSLPDSVPSEKA